MTMKKRKSFGTRVVTAVMSVLVAIPFIAGSASAAPSPPVPAYTGPLTWTDYTDPITPGLEEYHIPLALDFDDDDNLYITKLSSNSLNSNGGGSGGRIERLSNNGQSVTDITYNAAITYGFSIAADELGNVYVTDNKKNSEVNGNVTRVLKLEAGGNEWEDIGIGASLQYAMGITTDSEGNVYVVDSLPTSSVTSTPTRILKLEGGTWKDITGTLEVTSTSFIYDIAVDGVGNVYVGIIPRSFSGNGGSKIMKLPFNDPDWVDVTPTSVTNFIPYGMGIDKYSNLFVVSFYTGSVLKLGYNGESDDWTQIVATPAQAGSIFDVAANSLGYVFSTNLSTGMNVKTMRASVIYSGNGAVGTVPSDKNAYQPNESATVLGAGTLTKTGYTFSGWATSPTAEEAEFAPGETINMTETVTLYAVWTPIPVVTLTGVQLDSPAYTLFIEDTHQSVVTAIYSDSSTEQLTTGVTFTSDNTEVATVDNSGLVTAISSGVAVITASHGGMQATATVTVALVPPPIMISEVQLDSSAYTLSIGGTHQSVVTAIYSNSSTEQLTTGVTFTSDNTEVAAVDSTGLVTAISGGEAIITASYGGKQATATVTVTPAPPITLTEVQLDSSAYTLSIRGTHQSVVTAVYSNSSTKQLTTDVTFTSNNTEVATVDSTGLVTAIASGEAIITASYGGMQATATVTVQADSPSVVITPQDPGIEIFVDGVKQEQLATAQKSLVDGRNVTTVVLDSGKIANKLDRDNNKLITIPVTGDSQDVVSQLNVSLVRKMQEKDAILQIQTDNATYTLPASQIDITGILSQLGQNANSEDIKVNIRISATSGDNQEKVQSGAQQIGAQLVQQPVDFEITATYGTQSVDANRFNSYVERAIAIPDGVDPNKITTGVVLNQDGSLSHVPTAVTQQNGRHYATINSLTNSTYSIIYNPREMSDVSNHWAKDDVNDLTSRLIVQGVSENTFAPDAAITRAEFAATVTRGLGIRSAAYTRGFSDVAASDWFAGSVQAAVDYKLIAGYEDGSFRPNALISRQEAAVILARAAVIVKLGTDVTPEETDRLLSSFSDGSEVAGWSRAGVATVVNLRLLHGREDKLDLHTSLTRAEAAALVRRLLQTASLIDQ